MAHAAQYEKIIIVTRKTRLQELIERYNTRDQARFVYHQRAAAFALGVSAAGVRGPARKQRKGKAQEIADDFPEYEEEDRVYRVALERLQESLDFGLKLQVIDRSYVPSFLFTEKDLIVTAGQDGLVANTAKYVGAQPIVAVNPDPKRLDGVLMPFKVEDAAGAVHSVLSAHAKIREVTMAEAVLDTGQRLRAFNDLFIGARTHISARYRIRFNGRDEMHSSSGVLVSTGVGSTGWLSSMFNMAAGVQSLFSSQKTVVQVPQLKWEDRRLAFIVREPFISKTSAASLVGGLCGMMDELFLESMMPTNGVIFSDGVEQDFVEFNAGVTARICAAEQRARLVTQ